MDLTPQVMGLLEQVRVAVVEGRLSEAEQLMIRVRNSISLEGRMEFVTWFGLAVLGKGKSLTVPLRITTLPCGHTRLVSDPQFVLRCRNGGWGFEWVDWAIIYSAHGPRT